jgi:hypothetical protein
MHYEDIQDGSFVELGFDEYWPLPHGKSGPHPDDDFCSADIEEEFEMALAAEEEWEFWRGFVEQELQKEDANLMAQEEVG